MEGFAGQPDPRSCGIDVSENPQDARPLRGPRRERIHVQKIVAPMRGQVASLFLQRAEAGKIQLESAGIGTQEIGQKSRHRRSVMAHDVVQSLAVVGALARGPVQFPRLWPVRDVLVKARLRLLLRYQKLLVSARQIE